MRQITKKNTTNSRVYKMIAIINELSCPMCPPNKGCNRKRDWKARNWKDYRNNQWKN